LTIGPILWNISAATDQIFYAKAFVTKQNFTKIWNEDDLQWRMTSNIKSDISFQMKASSDGIRLQKLKVLYLSNQGLMYLQRLYLVVRVSDFLPNLINGILWGVDTRILASPLSSSLWPRKYNPYHHPINLKILQLWSHPLWAVALHPFYCPACVCLLWIPWADWAPDITGEDIGNKFWH
jgi:hypothetical protein